MDSNAGVVKLVDTLDLGSSASRCEGSSPFARTPTNKALVKQGFIFYFSWEINIKNRLIIIILLNILT